MGQMRTELGFILKHVTRRAEKTNAVNYLSKPPPPNDECCYEDDSCAVNEKTGGFQLSDQGSNQENWRHGQGYKGQIYGIHNHEDHYVRYGNYNCDNKFNKGNYGNRNDRNGPYLPPQNREVTLRDGGGSIDRVDDMLHQIMRRFVANDDQTKDLMSDLVGIGQSFDTHAISIKHLEYKWSNYLRL